MQTLTVSLASVFFLSSVSYGAVEKKARYDDFVFGPALAAFEVRGGCGLFVEGYEDGKVYAVMAKDCDQAKNLALVHHRVLVESLEKISDEKLMAELNEKTKSLREQPVSAVFRAPGQILVR